MSVENVLPSLTEVTEPVKPQPTSLQQSSFATAKTLEEATRDLITDSEVFVPVAQRKLLFSKENYSTSPPVYRSSSLHSLDKKPEHFVAQQYRVHTPPPPSPTPALQAPALVPTPVRLAEATVDPVVNGQRKGEVRVETQQLNSPSASEKVRPPVVQSVQGTHERDSLPKSPRSPLGDFYRILQPAAYRSPDNDFVFSEAKAQQQAAVAPTADKPKPTGILRGLPTSELPNGTEAPSLLKPVATASPVPKVEPEPSEQANFLQNKSEPVAVGWDIPSSRSAVSKPSKTTPEKTDTTPEVEADSRSARFITARRLFESGIVGPKTVLTASEDSYKAAPSPTSSAVEEVEKAEVKPEPVHEPVHEPSLEPLKTSTPKTPVEEKKEEIVTTAVRPSNVPISPKSPTTPARRFPPVRTPPFSYNPLRKMLAAERSSPAQFVKEETLEKLDVEDSPECTQWNPRLLIDKLYEVC